VDTSTLLSDSLAGNTPIGGAALSGTGVWIAGITGGTAGPVQYLTFRNSVGGGATGGTDLIPPAQGHRALRIFEGQLYGSTADGKIASIGNGLPTTGGQTETTLIDGIRGACEFEFLNLDESPGAEVLYVAVDASASDNGVTAGVKKYVFDPVAKTWGLSATFSGGVRTGFRGLAAYKDGENVVILTTTSEGDKLLELIDVGGPSVQAKVIATAPSGVAYRGVALSPTP
jgi:hypothetical protein